MKFLSVVLMTLFIGASAQAQDDELMGGPVAPESVELGEGPILSTEFTDDDLEFAIQELESDKLTNEEANLAGDRLVGVLSRDEARVFEAQYASTPNQRRRTQAYQNQYRRNYRNHRRSTPRRGHYEHYRYRAQPRVIVPVAPVYAKVCAVSQFNYCSMRPTAAIGAWCTCPLTDPYGIRITGWVNGVVSTIRVR